jgi:hypothetical protein
VGVKALPSDFLSVRVLTGIAMRRRLSCSPTTSVKKAWSTGPLAPAAAQ